VVIVQLASEVRSDAVKSLEEKEGMEARVGALGFWKRGDGEGKS